MSKHQTTIYASALIVALLSAQSASADTLYFTNGDKLSGEITDISGHEAIIMETGFGQTLTIPRSEVKRAVDDGGKPISLAPLNVAALTPDVVKVPSTNSLLGGQWDGRVNLGMTLQSGNTERENTNLDASASGRYGDAHRVTLRVEQVRETNNDVETEDNQKLRGEYDYFFKPKWFANSVLDFEQDNVEQVDLRSRTGVGIGHQFYESDGLNLKIITGPTYLSEKFSNGRKDESLAARWSLDYDQKIYRGLFQLFHSHELLVPTDNSENYLVDSVTGIRMPLGAGIVASAELQFDWDNQPEPGIQQDDTIYALKLGYEW